MDLEKKIINHFRLFFFIDWVDQCHQHPFNEKIGKFLGLVNTGLEMHAAYVKMANISLEEK